MKVPRTLLVHTLTITPVTGESSVGRVYGPPFTRPAFCRATRRLVVAADGSKRTSTLTAVLGPGQAATIPPGSRVEWNGIAAEVLLSVDHDDGGLGAPQHTEVSSG